MTELFNLIDKTSRTPAENERMLAMLNESQSLKTDLTKRTITGIKLSAGSINSGTLGNDYFSAYDNLVADEKAFIPIVETDTVPADYGQAWILRDIVYGSIEGMPLGLLLAITQTEIKSRTYTLRAQTPDGVVDLTNGPVVWDDHPVPVSSIRLPASAAPSEVDYKGGKVLAFSKSATNSLYFNAQLPHGWKEGTAIEFHIHTVFPDGNAGNARWRFTQSWADIGEDFPAETTYDVTVASPENADNHRINDLVASIDGTGKTLSSCLICSLSRLGGDGADTYDNVVYLISMDFHIQKDTMGSRSELVK